MTGTFSADEIKGLPLSLPSLSLYRSFIDEPVGAAIRELADSLKKNGQGPDRFLAGYGGLYARLVDRGTPVSLARQVIDFALYNDNAFTRAAASQPLPELDAGLLRAAGRELGLLGRVAMLTAGAVKACGLALCTDPFERELVESLPEWEPASPEGEGGLLGRLLLTPRWEDALPQLCDFHRAHGAGLFARYRGFVWGEGGLRGVESPDPIRLCDMIGYEREREVVVENTLLLLEGGIANNVLLYGDRGTGKSSTVKALLNEYHDRGLRVVELPHGRLCELPALIRAVKGSSLSFIFFIDDLAFEDSEESYTALKAVLEGGLESRPRNVVIYATSNRRHLIKERFSDREGLRSGDEVHAEDAMQEKLSLSDRFGITVTFLAPDQRQYMELVMGMAAQRGIGMEEEALREEAIRWEMLYNGRSPRTARQFIDSLSGLQKQ